MPPPFRKITLSQFEALLRELPFIRQINSVHMHHTWRPNRSQFKGHETLVGMWRFHTGPENRWRDLAQHLTIDPLGGLWLGRDWNLPPASASGHNGTGGAGPFMFEMIGDFDAGRDPFDGEQKEAAIAVVALLLDRFRLPTGSLRFHNQMSGKSCPGGSLSYERTLAEVEARRARPAGGEESVLAGAGPAAPAGEGDILFGDESEPEGEDVPVLFGDDGDAGEPAGASDEVPAEPSDEGGVQDLILSLMSGDAADGGAESPFAELPEREGPSEFAVAGPASPGFGAAGQEGVFGPSITTDMKEAMRPHVINLTRGRLSSGGIFSTSEEDLDRIFGEDLERAVAGRDSASPLKIVIWAHGGLVSEAGGLSIAYQHVLWWNANGVYPLYFVWETGLFDALRRVLGNRFGGGEEGVFTDRVTEFTDHRVEQAARLLGGVGVWGDMKESAALAAEPEGGAFLVARRLADFCARHDGAVELHAAGHSAGSIFHAHFLDVAQRQGVPPFENLFLLAPAIRVDEFFRLLEPLLGTGRQVRRVSLFTMNQLRELADTCIGLYRKSLLYLIHFALEKERGAPILGMETVLRGDPRLRDLFGLGGASPGATPAGQVIWSKSPASAALDSRSQSTSHGGFDNDADTMDSLLRRMLRRDDIPLSFAKAATLSPESAVPGGTGAPGPGFIRGEEGVAGSAAGEGVEPGVAFELLDALERVAELTPDEAVSGPEAFLAGDGLETPGGEIEIAFAASARSADVTDFSRGVLTAILRAAGLRRVVVSSTSRSPAEQARVMYQNLQRFGVEHQKALYAAAGDQVIEVYRQARQAGKDEATIRDLMTREIVRLGPTRVSRHASDPKVLNVFDVAPSSVADPSAFERAVAAEARIAKFLKPPGDPGYHLEIPQPRA